VEHLFEYNDCLPLVPRIEWLLEAPRLVQYQHSSSVIKVDRVSWSAVQPTSDKDPVHGSVAVLVDHELFLAPNLVEELVQG